MANMIFLHFTRSTTTNYVVIIEGKDNSALKVIMIPFYILLIVFIFEIQYYLHQDLMLLKLNSEKMSVLKCEHFVSFQQDQA